MSVSGSGTTLCSAHLAGGRCVTSDTRMTCGVVGYTEVMAREPALIRMLRAGRDEGADLEGTLEALARVFGRRATAERVGPHFTCAEANRIAEVLIASRHTDAAIVWLDEHAASDSEEDTHGGAGFDAVEYIRSAGFDAAR